MNLKEKVKNLPSTPGVYLMKDSLAGIIYVGKAKNLKNRVRSYFQNSNAQSKKIIRLKANIKDFNYTLTDTEFEAFMLECKLIREIKPFFNKKMKSPQSYSYIMVHMDGGYLRIDITNRPKDSCLYFGPYTSKHTVESALQGIKEFYKINCSTPSKKNNPCLNYSLGLCIGICLGGQKLEQNNSIMNKIIALLNGTDTSMLVEMNQRMVNAAENFEFEVAAKYRDNLDAILSIINKGKVIEFTEKHNNIAIIEYLTDITFKLFLINGNKILFSEKYRLEKQQLEQVCTTIQSNILIYFNNEALSPSKKVSRDEIDEAQIIFSYLKSSNCRYVIISEEWLDPVNKESLHVELYKLVYKQK
ncbi:MAG: GIY-YIG nuclease family protein [Bacillus sp. (in: Bacteria)]|nr:GIY-YIG nuclease family protein [Bacillus sp. (in: firmicutes)]